VGRVQSHWVESQFSEPGFEIWCLSSPDIWRGARVCNGKIGEKGFWKTGIKEFSHPAKGVDENDNSISIVTVRRGEEMNQ
jgi:hypothetical protein